MKNEFGAGIIGVNQYPDAYWGNPNNLRVKFTANLEYIEFYRKN